MASKQSKNPLELTEEIADDITLLSLTRHRDMITEKLDELNALQSSDSQLGEDVKLALAFEIVIRYYGGGEK
jgi:hypothetical protein